MTKNSATIVAIEREDHAIQYIRKGAAALVASDGARSIVLNHIGAPLDYWMDNVGELHEELHCPDPGLWLWEGGIDSHRSYEGEYDEELCGAHRALAPEEWEEILLNGAPWVHAEWVQADEEE